MERLDSESRELWEAKLGRNVMPKLKDLLEFLDDRVSYLTTSGAEKTVQLNAGKGGGAGIKKNVTAHQANAHSKCFSCDAEGHFIFNCPDFLKMSVKQRRDKVKQKNLCFNCMRPGHNAIKCKNQSKCKSCNKSHNTLLHFDELSSASIKKTDAVVAHMVNNDGNPCRALLATAYIPIVGGDGNIRKFRVLLDAGADVSFISENAVQTLKLKKKPTNVAISGLGANSVGTSRGLVSLVLKSEHDDEFMLNIEAYVVTKVTSELPRVPLSELEQQLFKKLVLADPYYAKPGRIDLLLGADIFFDILRAGRVTGTPGLPTAQETVWGYIIGGSCPSQAINHHVKVHHMNIESDLNDQLKRFWELEGLPKKSFYTSEEQQCEDHFVKTTKRKENGRYEVRFPFKNSVPELGSSFQQAVRRLKMMERQLEKNPDLKRQYIAFMDEYERLGHMQLIPEDEVPMEDGKHFYLPHHPVIKAESTTTKCRVVFDASAKSSTKVSLNDRLHTGPKLQDDLFAILIRFRMHNVALKSDIAKMYRQILMFLPDCQFQRIVWRCKPEDSIKSYWLLTVTYGTSVAPYHAKRCLQQLTEDEEEAMPEACEIARNDFYMDDLMSGASDVESAIFQQQQLQELLGRGGFDLRKWVSNSPEVLQTIPIEKREAQVPFSIDKTETVKTLGIVWEPATDLFKFKVNMSQDAACTKRQVSSCISKLFDPLGWLSPITICAKMTLQDLWKSKCEWDEMMPDNELSKWRKYVAELPQLEKLSIARSVYDKINGPFDIFGFCDASIRAYVAVVYVRRRNEDGTVTVDLLAAKSKPAPVKQESLPRLELCGSVLLARLIDAIVQGMKTKPVGIFAWSDSTIVLEWLKGHPSKWNTFVGNRVAQVQGIIPSEQWRHVAGVQNPADVASRGTTVTELRVNELWWYGPEWLRTFEAKNWKDSYDVDTEAVYAEQKRSVLVMHNRCDADFKLMDRCSSLNKLLRVSAYVVRFIVNLRAKVQRKALVLGPVTLRELDEMRRYWLMKVQKVSFGEEFTCLQHSQPLPRNSKLLALNPFIDEAGILRVGGRLKNADISFGHKFPMLLPKYHRLTELIVNHEHKVNLHAGPQLLLATLCRQYWILGARDSIRYWLRRCVVCAKQKADSVQQMMGNLPVWRVNPAKPFLRTGVDYAGPYELKMMHERSRVRRKGYIAIFICFATKAIHLEMVCGLKSQDFIKALRRFVARRGKCQELISDCGRSFVGAQKELAVLMRKSYQDELSQKLVADGIRMTFNPPGAPHFGGLWEAGLKSVKYHLRRVMGTVVLTYEEMETLVVQIEACLNSRPISPMTNDPNDLQPLTPGHFLVGDALTSVPDPNYIENKVSHMTRWQLLQRTLQQFWHRWSQEYLTRLQQRPKWWSQKTNLEVGNLVLIKDERFPPMRWKLGRVVMIHPGSDNLVRVVTLRTADGEVKRPVTKLSLLPIDTDAGSG